MKKLFFIAHPKSFPLASLRSRSGKGRTFYILLLLFSLPFGKGWGWAFAQPSFIKDSLDKYIEREMKRWNVPGAAVAVVKDGKVVVMKGYGVRDASTPLSMTNKVDENTLFQIASNSKAFT